MLIGDVGLAELTPGLRRAEKTLGREVNPAIYSPREFLQRHEEEDSFVTTIMSDSKIFLKGSDSELKGSGLRITATGVKTFIVEKRIDG